MAVNSVTPTVSEPRFRESLDKLRTSYANNEGLVRELERFVRTAPDDQIVRINPIQYAADRGRGRIIASFHTLNAANEHSFCKTCLAGC